MSQQKAMGIDIHNVEFDQYLHSGLMGDTSDFGEPLGAVMLARALSNAGLGAAKWHGFPVDSQSTLSDEAMRGILCNKVQKTDRRVQGLGLHCVCGAPLTQHHLHDCGRTGWNTRRHNNVVRGLSRLARDCGHAAVTEIPWDLGQQGRREGRMDLLIKMNTGELVAVDVHVTQAKQGDTTPGAAAARAETFKNNLAYHRSEFAAAARVAYFGVCIETGGTMGMQMRRLIQRLGDVAGGDTTVEHDEVSPHLGKGLDFATWTFPTRAAYGTYRIQQQLQEDLVHQAASVVRSSLAAAGFNETGVYAQPPWAPGPPQTPSGPAPPPPGARDAHSTAEPPPSIPSKTANDQPS